MPHTEITLLDPLDKRWLAFTDGQPNATIFHHPSWMELLRICYSYKPAVFAMLDSDAQPVAALPFMQIDSWLTGRRMVSMPFSDFCQPLAANRDTMSKLIAGLQSWRCQNRFQEMHIHWTMPSTAGVYPTETFARHITYLNFESQQVMQKFAKTQVQQRIHKAEREGLFIRMSTTWEALQLFYGMHLKTRRRLGTPIQPLRFFRILWEQLISQDLGFVILAYKDSRLLAGAVFLHYNKTLTYKYSASDPSYWRLRPNNLILWRAICWGCEHGHQVFDWGRTDLDHTGLREFKLGWGSEEQIIHYSVLADRPPKLIAGGWRKRFQTSLIRYSPNLVCRLIGELFYQHFA